MTNLLKIYNYSIKHIKFYVIYADVQGEVIINFPLKIGLCHQHKY